MIEAKRGKEVVGFGIYFERNDDRIWQFEQTLYLSWALEPARHRFLRTVLNIFHLYSFFLNTWHFLKILFISRERGREGEREGEKHQCVVTSHVAPTGDLACNPGMCPDWESNWRPFGSQPVLSPLSYTSQGYTLHLKKKCWEEDSRAM